MASKARKLVVSISGEAFRTVDAIWDWNAATYNAEHATRYIDFLRAEVGKLASKSEPGPSVRTRPSLHYVLIRHRHKGHGHVAVYELNGDSIVVLNFFHSAQDWENKLGELGR